MLRELVSVVHDERHIYPFFPEKRMIWCALGIMFGALMFTDVKLFGHKTEALIDVWFLQHVFSGIMLCFGTIALRNYIRRPLVIAIFLAYSWEGLEYWLEIRSHEAIMLWFDGLEHPLNKFLVDPLAATIGFALVKYSPNLIYPAIIFAIFFLGLHLWLGDSMAIQNIFIGACLPLKNLARETGLETFYKGGKIPTICKL